MKKKYWVYSHETVYYMTQVLAESEEEAVNLIEEGEISVDVKNDAVDGERFEVEYAKLVEE